MNHIYKTVFNKTTQTWTAVTEWAKGAGKSSVIKNLSTKAAKAPSKPTHSTTLLVKSIITASLTLVPNAFAENNPIATKVVADYNTPKSLQPIILPTSSGLPQINIRTPNAKGVSNNHYGQFDVGSAGIVLNNSRKPIVTNLAGFVDGNPYMARGEASLIINQVNSNQPANLNGFVEVAGKKADLIIASPAGILVDGGGFINAGGVSLSTIAPSIDWAGNVHLDPTQSTQGAIGINGKGLNTEGMDYTKLIASTTHINAKVHAGEGDLTLINQNAVDVSHLGGMYAGRIHLIGTQAGVGVNNAGVIASNSTLTLDNKGKLTNSGLMNAKEDIQINSQSINNTGKISAVGTVSAGKQQSLNNEGVIEGNQLRLSANTFTNTGAIKQTGLGDLTLTADTLINKDGASIGHPIITEETDPTTPPQTASTSTPTTPPTDHSPKKAGFLTATTLQNLGESAVIVTGGEIDINVNTLINQKGSINARSLTPQENFNNQGGKINLHDIDWRLKSFNNQGGHLSAKNSLKLKVQSDINNHDGKLIAGQTLSLGTNANINNQNGVINGGTVQLNSNTLNNQGGHIFGKQSLTAKANSIDNTQGQIGGGHLSLTAQSLDNTQGMIQGQSLDVSANELYNSGQLYGENALTLTVNTLSNDKAGVIAGGSSVSISSDTINNLGTFAAGMMSDGSLTGQANLSIHAKTALNSQGKHIATGNASLSSQVLNLENSHSSGGALTLQSEQSLNLKNSVQTASGKMLLSTNETIDNTQGKVSAGTLALNATKLINRQGSMTEATGDTLSLNLANGIDNTEGFIGSGSQTLQINTNALDNQKGQIVHTGHKDSQINASTINNNEGRLASLGQLSITSHELNNQSGQVRGAGFDIDALKLDNHLGKIAATQSYEAVNSRLITPNLNNTQGIIHSQTGTLLMQTGGFDNNKGTLSANNLELDSESLTNTGLIYAKQNATLNNQGTFDNKTLIATGGDLDINTQSFTQDKDARLLAGYSYDTKNFEGSSTLKLTATGQLTNQGVAKATGAMSLTADRLHLEDSKLSADSLALNSNTNTNLSSATVETQKELSIDSSQTITHDGAHTQAGSIHIKAAALSNKEGVINQTQDTTLELSLNNLDNTKGTLVSKAALASLNIDHLNNTAGKISTDAKTGTLTTKTLNNTQGLMDGNHLDITSSQSLSNQTGILTAKALSIRSATLDNTQGLVHQSGKDTALSLTIDGTLNNSQTQGEGLGIMADKVQITAKTTNNAQGTIKANTLSTHTTTLNNTQGLIRANQANLDTHTTQNTGGLIEAGSLSLSVKEGYTHESAGIKADTLNLTATGGLYNKGELTAESLNLVTDHLHNEEGATIGSNSHTKITADTLNNRGLINGTDTHLLIKEEVNNFSNGRIYGDHLAIATKTLNNTPDKQGAKAPIIAARHRLDLGVHTLNNNPNKDRAGKFNKDFDNQAQIVSYGSLHIGGSLDDTMHATGTADTIINKGATIESADEMVINTGKLSNENADFSKHKVVVEEESKRQQTLYRKTNTLKIYTSDEAKLGPTSKKGAPNGALYVKNEQGQYHFLTEEVDEIKVDYMVYEEKTRTSDPARLVAGKNLTIHGKDLVNDKSQLNAGEGFAVLGDSIVQSPDGQLQGKKTKETENGFFISRTVKPSAGGRRHKRVDVAIKPYPETVEYLSYYPLPILDSEIQTTPSAIHHDKITHAITIQDTLTGLNKELTGGFIDSKKITDAIGNIDPVIINSLDAITKETLTTLIKEAKTHPKVMPLSLEKTLTHLDHHIKRLSSIEVRTDDSEVLLNTAGLWQTESSNNKYLVQSDPNFAHYKPWASSDYLLTRLGQTPSEMHKRLSDGFGEQERLKNSYFKLTGKHWLSDYKNSDETYKALMDSALAQKDRLNLRAGIALSKEQMQNLTQDMVWMVKQSVTLPDGKKEEVLVPKLYVTANKSAVTGDKSGIYGKYANIDVARLDNQGLIHTQKDAHINATHLKNTQGGKIHADTLVLTAKTLDNTDGHLYANTSLKARVEGKLTSHSNTQTASIRVGDGALVGADAKDLSLTLDVRAGKLDTQGSLIENLGGKSIIQGRNGVVLDSQSITKTTTAKANEHNYHSQTQTKDQGTQIYGVGDVLVYSDQGSITGVALDAKAEGTLALIAKDQITLTEGRNKQTINSASSKKERRLLGKKQHQNQFELSQDEAMVGQLSGNAIHIASESSDVSLIGTNLKAQDAVSISAKKGEVTIQSAVNSTYQNTTHTTKNFYKNTGSVNGSYKETLAQTGISAGNIDIQGQSASINAARLQAKDSIVIGNATLATNPDGTLKQDENGKPIVLSGDTENLNFGTVTLANETWNENTKSYRGLAKVGMQAVGVVAGALNIANGITTAKSNKEHTKSQEEKTSQLKANHIVAGAKQVTAFGTDFETTESGSTTILGQNILLGSAQTSTETTSTSTRQTITGEGIKLGKDHIQLGAVVHTNTKNSQTTKEDSHKGVTINSQNTLVLADMKSGTLVTQGTKFKEQEAGGSLLLGAKTTLLDGVINGTSTTQDNKTDTTRIGASVHHVALDTAVAAANLVDATKAVNDARLALKDAKEAVANGTLDANAIKDYELNLAMATANAANAQIALGSTAATAAPTYPTLGFSAKVSASHTKDKHQETKTTEDFAGTQINSTNTTLVGDSLTAKGLEAQIGTLTVANLGHLNLTHGTTKDTHASKGDSKTVNASYSTSGAVSAGIGTQSDKAGSTSTTAHDSKLIVGSLNGNAKVTTLNGAHITAYGGDYQTDKLIVTTSQNSQTTHAKKQGGNIGLGTGSLSLGYNNQKNQSDITTNNAPSGITYVNADASHGSSHSLIAKETILTGGVIAAVNQDKEGNVTNSNLNFTTNTLTTNDLVAKEHSQTRGINASVGIAAKGDDAKLSSVGLGLTKEGHEKETKALATVGQGATITGTITHNGQAQASTDLTQTNINTDTLNTQQVIKDQKTGGLNFNTTVDTRAFSKEGREGIKKEQEKLDENLKATAKITAAAGVQVVATTANVLTGNQTLTQAIQSAKAPAKMAKAIQDNPKLAAILDAYQKGDYHNLTLSQEALQALSDATGISTEVLLTSITAQRGKQGATNKTLTVIDTHDELREDSIQTLVHELDHIRGGKNETLADLAGLAAKLNTDAAIIANQDTINPIKAQLGDGKDAQTTAQNQALLKGNDKTFVENHDGREGEWEYRQLRQREINVIKIFAQDYAKEKGLTVDEAEKLLARGALYHIDAEWQATYNNNEQTRKEVGEYQDAYQYLINKTKSFNRESISGDPVLQDIIDDYNKTTTVSFNNKYDYNKSAFTATKEDFYNPSLFKNETLNHQDSKYRDFYYKNASTLTDINPNDLPKIMIDVYRSYKDGQSNGAINTLKDNVNGLTNLPNIDIKKTKEYLVEKYNKAKQVAFDEDYRNQVIDGIKNEAIDEFNTIQLDVMQGKFSKVAQKAGEVKGGVEAQVAVDAAATLAGAGVGGVVAKTATTAGKLGKVVDGGVDDKYGDVKANLDSSTGENVFAQNPNIRFGSAEDRQKATDRIAKHRTDNGLNNKGNFGYLEGTINGQAVDNRIRRSTSLDKAIEETHIFTSTEVTGSKGETWNRMTDTEYRMLNRLAQDLGAKKGGVYPNVRGELKIVSENKICESCQGVIKQFNTMFPNIKLTLIGGVRKQ